MPELPEVETMAKKLQGWAVGQMIKRTELLRGERYLGGRGASDTLMGRRILDVRRAGKMLLFELDNATTLACHNAMSGYWDVEADPWTFDYVEGKRTATERDVRVKLHLDGNILRFHDSRCFATMRHWRCRPFDIPAVRDMGPEAIQTDRMLPGRPIFCSLDAAVNLTKPKPIKELLLKQELLAGVGNIYAVEALWWARLRPDRLGDSLKANELYDLTVAIQQVLAKALDKNLDYTSYLKVYRQAKCDCGESISKIAIAKRNTYFCVHCQH